MGFSPLLTFLLPVIKGLKKRKENREMGNSGSSNSGSTMDVKALVAALKVSDTKGAETALMKALKCDDIIPDMLTDTVILMNAILSVAMIVLLWAFTRRVKKVEEHNSVDADVVRRSMLRSQLSHMRQLDRADP